MDIVNRSGFPVEVTTAVDREGREHLVVVGKSTWRFGLDGAAPTLEHEQAPVALTDTFHGEVGSSAPRYEADTSLRKRRCDIVVDATAYAPEGRAVTELTAGVRVGATARYLHVTGDRAWRRGAFGLRATAPQSFTAMPLHYGRAFGGSPALDGAGARRDLFAANPVGTGFCSDPRAEVVDGMALPNLEDPGARVTSPNVVVRPVALGPLGRHWHPRQAFAGTYDARWRAERFPFLPEDFDEAFFQCVPPEQQADALRGGEPVTLYHLSPERPMVTFELPRPELVLKVLTAQHHAVELAPVIDTLFLDVDARRLSLVFRSSLPLGRRGVLSLKILAAGPVCRRWWESKVLGTEDCGCGGDDSRDPTPPVVGGPGDPAWDSADGVSA